MKPDPMLAKLRKQHKAEMRCDRQFLLQMCEDMLFIALDEVDYHDKEHFVKVFWDVFLRWADMNHADYNADKSTVYTKADVDRRLRQIRGEHYVEREERYFMVKEKK